ncbi:triacylglycerol lipase ASCRUDRAFT_74369 [Ascoidea rubescens DSM 1968]|uniref:Uncharacterized protein n=1 Tax=Ascoidea rubescens DSM 1968 TaxID=1344418 RepID=A0A1D2VMT9_9ASCO|nr:hypothetical protein ASCRUDRAFT_74369 [Ascoidea rubescens DSM 1968]ODV62920.1 hypothetical protein ASCRUDRAFT_74369 [Ascoidea rubescens DSM 1968]
MSGNELEEKLIIEAATLSSSFYLENDTSNSFIQQLLEYEAKYESYNNIISKLSLFFKKIFIYKGNHSKFEKLILNEPADCTLLAKYSSIEKFLIANDNNINQAGVGLGVEVYLNTLRIPHPLERFIPKIQNINLTENSRNLNFPNLNENLTFLKNLKTNLNTLPLVIFIHGLGGQLSQFESLFALLSQFIQVFAVDLPGFGKSSLSKNKGNLIQNLSNLEFQSINSSIGNFLSLNNNTFTTSSIVNLLHSIITTDPILKNRKLILISHSMGTHIAIKLALKLFKNSIDKSIVTSLILLSPPSLSPPVNANDETINKTLLQLSFFKIFLKFPKLFNYIRLYDRLGGFNSNSLKRVLNINTCSYYQKARQLRWNMDIDSVTWLKYISGFQPLNESDFISSMSFFNSNSNSNSSSSSSSTSNSTSNSNASMNMPKILIVCGENDNVTPYSKGTQKMECLLCSINVASITIPIANCGHSILLEKPELACGLILKFISNNIDSKLNPSWVLTIKAIISGDKWGLKNIVKWESLQNISFPIQNPSTFQFSPLLAMKTLRQDDDNHSPSILELKNPDIVAIIDISADLPPYNPTTLKRIKYYKLATVSKIPPDSLMVRKFISLVDDILFNQPNQLSDPRVVVHCHYGFNRTGFLICCYLIEKLSWSVADAVLSFKKAKYPGIKHPHFVDALYLRYN